MKAILLFATMFFVVSCSAQLTERDAIKKDHIDLTKETVFFTIHGLVEFDGHTFINDTSANPFMFFANVDGIKITRKGLQGEYKHRVCGTKDCPILHLELIGVAIISPPTWQWWNHGEQLLNNGAVHLPIYHEDNIGVDLDNGTVKP